MTTMDLRRCCLVAALTLAIGFAAKPASAQCDVGISAYADGTAGSYNGDGEAPLHFWGSGIDNSSCPGAYHWYALEVSVKDAYDNTPVFRSGTTELYDEVVLPPGFYIIAAAFWVNCSIINGNVGWADDQSSPVQLPLRIPTGETSIFDIWIGPHAFWNAVLLPAGVSFDGRTVKEYAGGVGTDFCHFTGADVDAFDTVTGGPPWPVRSNNDYGADEIGYGTNQIDYYRIHVTLPCYTTIPQSMRINNGLGQDVEYLNHNLIATILSTSVRVQRGAADPVERAWP
jgi:hypothetical protein